VTGTPVRGVEAQDLGLVGGGHDQAGPVGQSNGGHVGHPDLVSSSSVRGSAVVVPARMS
jgi:hypothetical protein